MKPFSSIPGPKALPYFGTTHLYLLKHYNKNKLHQNGLKNFLKYGPVVREDTIGGKTIVWIYDPEDIKNLFQNEGKNPARRSHLALEHLRKNKPWVYQNGGLLPTNGEEWAKLRKMAQKPLADMTNFIKPIGNIADDFVAMLKTEKEYWDIHAELKKYFVEVTGYVLYGKRFGAIQPNLDKSSQASILISAAEETNFNIWDTDNVKLWQYFETPAYTQIKESQAKIENVALQHFQDPLEGSLVHIYNQDFGANFHEIITLTSDFLLAGIDTSANSMAFLLYELAKSRQIQNDLDESIQEFEDTDEKTLKMFKLGKAIIKESFRLHPIAVGVGRTLACPAVFSGYEVPAGTNVVTQNQVSCRLEQFCPRKANEFWPYRHLSKSEKLHPFLSLPFGFGPRMCIGRRLAEKSIQILLFKLSKSFHLQLEADQLQQEMDCVSYLINQPEMAIKLKLKSK